MAHEVGTLTTPELVKEAYGKARELEHSFPDISQLMRALATRLDVRNVLAAAVCKSNVKRLEPDYQIQMNHELAFMRECPAGRYVQFDVLADLIEQNAHLHLIQTTIALALNLPGQRNFSAEVIERVVGNNFEMIGEPIQ
ncbi:hypothetical protein [Erwinia rhapontici]|uniref:hypothetical protein n=1 Tax=Erwinia rhapontici TaxID=55212 RepID=UPI00216872FC|nr:hypothetical protein [Erwinia rhapontici]MCS3605289.1 hypothetical protein [Erwinia rhapontici]